MNKGRSRYTTKDIEHKFDGQSRLGYAIQGKRGGEPQVKDDIGSATLFVDNSIGCQYGGNTIKVDAFGLSEDGYSRQKKCEIVICRKGMEIFRGDFNSLADELGRNQ
jgi:hypothetical protein